MRTTYVTNVVRGQWRKSDGKKNFFWGGGDDTACGPQFESLIHIIATIKHLTQLKTTYIRQNKTIT